MKIRHLPVRAVVGAFMLNSGLGKFNAPPEAAKQMRDMGSAAVPQLQKLKPEDFGKLLAGGETALGAALLIPFVPTWVGAVGLGAFSAGLVTMYLKTPGMTEEDGIRPTAEGTSLAKDSWLAAIAGSLIRDEITTTSRARRKAREASRIDRAAHREAKKIARELARS